MRVRFLSVPKNETGVKEYDIGVEYSTDLELYEINEDEFKLIAPVLDVFNNEFGLLIDDYESEIIPNEYLKRSAEILEEHSMKKTIFYRALQSSIEHDTFIALDF